MQEPTCSYANLNPALLAHMSTAVTTVRGARAVSRSITTNEFRLRNVIEPGEGATRSGCLPIPCGRSG